VTQYTGEINSFQEVKIMRIHKIFSWVLFVALMAGTTFTPSFARVEMAILKRGNHTFDKAQPASPPQALNDTHTVCASGCDFSSIQAAINSAVDGDTIDLAAETFTEAVTIDKSINLEGDGPENTIVQAAGEPGIATSRVITITSGITVTIENITIQHGNAIGDYPDSSGGGIYNSGTLTLNNIVATNNFADGTGGGILSTGFGAFSTNLTINDSLVRENTAQNAGGIYLEGWFTAANLIVQENQATSGNGGGIYLDGRATIINSQIISNTADTGGGIYNYYVLTLENCSVTDNSANVGAGIYNDTDLLYIHNSSIVGNHATGYGGGIFNDYTAYLHIDSSVVKENQGSSGGGVYINSESSYDYPIKSFIEASTIISNTALANSGGGIQNRGKLELSNSLVAYNSAEWHGGGLNSIGTYSTLDVLNSTFSNNRAKYSGGGIYTDSNVSQINHSTIAENTADSNHDGNGSGGGLYNNESGGTFLKGTIIANNFDQSSTAPDCGGFAIDTQDYNLISDTTGCSFSTTAPHDLLDQPAEITPLGDFGGNSQTYALQSNSLAIDAGICTDIDGDLVTEDQRGYLRPIGNTCDIGAFEKEGLYIQKDINNEYPLPGEVVTFTIQAKNTTTNTITGALISDTLPTGLEFTGPIILAPSDAGTVGLTPPIVASDLTIDAGEWITVTFPVTISNTTDFGTMITNTTTITDSSGLPPARTSQAFLVCGNDITVTSTTDNGPGSLRTAIAAACPGGTINFSLPSPSTITLTSGELRLERSVTINGPGSEALSISADRSSRVFYITGENVSISGLTIRDGYVGGSGGGIYNLSSLYVSNSLFTNNYTSDYTPAEGGGGAIYNGHIISITHSTFISNTASAEGGGGGGLLNAGFASVSNSLFLENHAVASHGYGGGIQGIQGSDTFIDGCSFENNSAEDSGGGLGARYAEITIENSTFYENYAQKDGGAINNDRSSIAITNSTISGNNVDNDGGGIWAYSGSTYLDNVTLDGNSAVGDGNDVFREYGNILSRNSIFASRLEGESCATAYSFDERVIRSHGYNLSADDSCTLDQSTDVVNVNPLLKDLADNGSLTLTHALSWASPAVDAGSCLDHSGDTITRDQRGESRPVWQGCDIGAYEFADLGISKSVDDPMPGPGQQITFTINAINLSAETITDGVISDSLPSGLIFVGPITLDPPGAGIAGLNPPILASNIELAFGEQITLTFPTTVDAGQALNTYITNTAVITSANTSLENTDDQILHICLDVFTVTSNANSGLGSLRQGIVDVCPGGTIDFDLTYPDTISLTTGELVIDKPLTIQGPGKDLVAISGDYTQRVFNISSGVNISGITIRDGFTTENGGGIYHTGVLTIAQSEIISNNAEMGGGIYSDNGSKLHLTDSSITDNQAGTGGGIYGNENTNRIDNSSIFSNTANYSGGGIYLYSSVLTVTNSIVSDNTANEGAGLYLSSADTTIVETEIANNDAIGSYAEGGGIHNSSNGGSLQITDCDIHDNAAAFSGGGIYASYADNIYIINSRVFSNTASGGGGIYNDSGSTIEIMGSSIEENSANSGGGIYTTGNAITLRDSAVSQNTANNRGGGITHESGSMTIDSTSLIENSTDGDGGGIYRNQAGPLKVMNATFSGNMAANRGGGIYNYATSGSSTINHSTIVNNMADSDSSGSGDGGGIYQSGGASIALESTILANNTDMGGESPDCGGDSLYSFGHNLIENLSNCSLNQDPSDIVGQDPNLAAIADNGGTTPTHALQVDSPAIDSGNCEDYDGNPLMEDQRGVIRPQGLTCDIGAFELIPDLWLIKSVSNSLPLPGEMITFTLQLTNNLPETITDGVISDSLPAGLNFVGPITLEPALSGTVGSAPPLLATNLVIAPGMHVTVTFPVSVSQNIGCGAQVINYASASSNQASAQASNSAMITIPYDAYPPVVHTVCTEGCDFTSIQTAIDASCYGDTIALGEEIFTEPFTVYKNVTVLGKGAGKSIVQAASEPELATSRVITVTPGTETTIEGLTIRYGNATLGTFPENGGGGIFNQGILTLTHSTIFSNTAEIGGGIFNLGDSQTVSANITFCNFIENVAYTGGGISNYGNVSGTAIAQITNSTFLTNHASGSGGGVSNTAYMGSGSMTIANSTFSKNSATSVGGGIATDGFMGNTSLLLKGSTLSENSAGASGGAISSQYSVLSLSTSILSNSTNGTDCDFLGTINDLNYNLVEDGSCGFPVGGDPLLGPLQDNGGPTWTHALLSGSPAIDAIPVGECSFDTDQRGVARPQGAGCDIGAFEFQYNLSAGPDQTTDEGKTIQFNGSSDNPDIAAIHWDFGDGYAVTDTLTPTHTYLDDGVYTVTLTVTDTFGTADSDWLFVTVENVAPTLSTFPNLEITAGETITITGTITDPGVLDSQTVLITWESGATETIELAAAQRQFSATYTYADAGLYPVTVRVTDKDGDWNEQSFSVTVSSSGYWIFIPIVKR